MILGIDPGTKRVGLALADLETRFARPLSVVDAETAVARVLSIVEDEGVTTVVIGRPVSLSGSEGAAVDLYRGFVEEVRRSLPPEVEVVEHDERLTSVIAQQNLRQAGVSSKKARRLVDAAAAQVMLQGYLDATEHRR